MPNKSRRNQRRIAVKRGNGSDRHAIEPTRVNSVFSSQSLNPGTANSSKLNLSENKYSPYSYVLGEFKWIAITTGIIVVIMLVCYFTLH